MKGVVLLPTHTHAERISPYYPSFHATLQRPEDAISGCLSDGKKPFALYSKLILVSVST